MNHRDVFLSGIRNARAQLKNPADRSGTEGTGVSKYSLFPSLLRTSRGLSKEQELFHKYRQAATYLLKARESDWETVFDMQHYGIPTRLLDWTETLGVAVFFALGTEPSEAAVYVLDPMALNRLATGTPQLKHADDPSFSYRSVYWKDRLLPRLPIALDPPFQNKDIRSARNVHDPW